MDERQRDQSVTSSRLPLPSKTPNRLRKDQPTPEAKLSNHAITGQKKSSSSSLRNSEANGRNVQESSRSKHSARRTLVPQSRMPSPVSSSPQKNQLPNRKRKDAHRAEDLPPSGHGPDSDSESHHSQAAISISSSSPLPRVREPKRSRKAPRSGSQGSLDRPSRSRSGLSPRSGSSNSSDAIYISDVEHESRQEPVSPSHQQSQIEVIDLTFSSPVSCRLDTETASRTGTLPPLSTTG